MKEEPRIRWELYTRDSERFCICPLKEEVKLWTALGGLAFIVIIHAIHYFWG